MTTPPRTPRKGFTLIELLTVIAIIGILASILIPTLGTVMGIAHRAASGNNAAQIAKTYAAFSNSSSNSRTMTTPQMAKGGTRSNGTAQNINDVAFILSKFQNLNDAAFWFCRQDEGLNGLTIPKVVISGDLQTATDVDPSFGGTKPKTWAFVTGMSTTAQGTTTPLLWTYGLSREGKWDTLKSPWKGIGGHIAFLDGHVQWYDRLSTDVGGDSLVVYAGNPNQGNPTADYMDAINSKAVNPAVVVNADGTN